MKELKHIKKILSDSSLIWSKECLQSLNKEEVIVHLSIPAKESTITGKEYYNIYKTRSLLEKQKTMRSTFGYKDLLRALEKSSDDHINVFTIFTNTHSYIVFYSESAKKVLGILKSISSNITEIERLISVYKERKLELNYLKLIDGKLIESFKES